MNIHKPDHDFASFSAQMGEWIADLGRLVDRSIKSKQTGK